MEDNNISNRLKLSYYKEITVLNKEHGIFVVQHTETLRLYIKKKAPLYSKPIYEQLKKSPIKGIPKTYELIELDDELIVIEEHISGHSLVEILNNDGPIDKCTVVDYAIKLCDILSSLHSLNPPIIHRDIKPSNVILTEDNRIVLIDLDGAKFANLDESRDTHLLGTTGFAAPEQYGFGPSNVQTDIFGIGKLLVALLTNDTEARKVSDKGLVRIINKCLQLDPARRYKSAKQLKRALMWQRPQMKIATIIISICIILLLVSATISIFSQQSKKAKSEEVATVESFVIETTPNPSETNKPSEDIKPLSPIESKSEEIDISSPIGAYMGDDKEILVINSDGLAYYYCNDPTFIEVECPWAEENNNLTICLSKLHCDITAKISDADYSELVFKSNSVNWNSEVFDKISSDAEKYIISPPTPASKFIPVKDNGDLIIDIGDFRFSVPKQFRDTGDYYNNSNKSYKLVDANADEYFVASAVFTLNDNPGNDLSTKYKQLTTDFAKQFLTNLQIGYSQLIKVADEDAYQTIVSGLLDDDFSKLTNQIVSGSVILINNPSTNKVIYILLIQTVGTKTDDTDAYDYILKEATLR